MELKNQVTSLELSKKLKELGVEQKSLFYWAEKIMPVGHKGKVKIHTHEQAQTLDDDNWITYSAFTVAELGKLLPWDIVVSRNIDKQWIVVFQADGFTDAQTYSWISDSEAEARAVVLIYLLENKLLATKDVSTRRREG